MGHPRSIRITGFGALGVGGWEGPADVAQKISDFSRNVALPWIKKNAPESPLVEHEDVASLPVTRVCSYLKVNEIIKHVFLEGFLGVHSECC